MQHWSRPSRGTNPTVDQAQLGIWTDFYRSRFEEQPPAAKVEQAAAQLTATEKFAALPAEDKATVEQVRKEIDSMAGPAHGPAAEADKKPN